MTNFSMIAPELKLNSQIPIDDRRVKQMNVKKPKGGGRKTRRTLELLYLRLS